MALPKIIPPAVDAADEINRKNVAFWDKEQARFDELADANPARFAEVASQLIRYLKAGHTADPEYAEDTGLESAMFKREAQYRRDMAADPEYSPEAVALKREANAREDFVVRNKGIAAKPRSKNEVRAMVIEAMRPYRATARATLDQFLAAVEGDELPGAAIGIDVKDGVYHVECGEAGTKNVSIAALRDWWRAAKHTVRD